MKTILLERPESLLLTDTPEPSQPGAGEALVRVHRVGVCGTDFHAFHGRQPFFSYPRILGHELGVEVLAVGPDVRNVQPGDRCAVEPYVNCQKCVACRLDRGNCCSQIRVLGVHTDGGMREQLLIPARKLHVANALNYDQIALVETLAIGSHAATRAGIRAGEQVLVIGAGPIGLSVLQFAKAAGAELMVLDISERRLAFCSEQLGIKRTILANTDGVAEKIRQMTGGDMASVVVDATGNKASMQTALNYVAHAGRLVYVGLFQGEFSLVDTEFHKRETTLMGSRNALPDDFTRIITLVENGMIDTRPWITHRAAAEQVPAEFRRWTEPDSHVLKAMIEF